MTFIPLQAMVITYSHAKVKVSSQLVHKIEWKQMDRRMDIHVGDCITCLTSAVSQYVIIS